MLASISGRVNTFVLVIGALVCATIIGILATRAGAGPLDPPAPPASTMHTLGDTPPAWDQVLNSTNGAPGPTNPPAGCNSDRFKCVMTYAQCGGVCITVYPAVLDEETGLVWQRTPDTTEDMWANSLHRCVSAMTGNRLGWRLPTMAELESLFSVDGKSLPAGNPFGSLGNTDYWSSSDDSENTAQAWVWTAFTGTGGLANKTSPFPAAWCVRGATSNR